MYTGPSPRSLGLSLIIHTAAAAALFTVPVPVPAPPLVATDAAKPTEIRIAGKLYYVSQIQGSQAAAQSTPRRNAPRAAEVGPSATPKLPYVAAPKVAVAAPAAPLPAPAAPAPLPEPVRILRQQARAFIPPQLKPNPAATQTLIQPLSPLDVTPPPTPLPNFRITADVSQMRKIPKPFVAPGRVTPPTPAQNPNVETPSMDLIPAVQMPPGEPLAILSLSDRPIPFSDKVVVPAGNIAQPPLPASADTGAAGSATGTSDVASGGAPKGNANTTPGSAPGGTSGAGNSANTARSGSPAGGGNPTAAASGASSPNGTGRGNVGNGAGAALTGGSKTGDAVAIVGGAGGSGGPPSVTPGSAAGVGTGAGTGSGTAAGAGTGSNSTVTPGQTVINRPAGGNFDTVVVQSSPTDQFPESRGLLSGRPIYSVYIPVGTAREWTLFFCIPGEKPEPGNGAVISLGKLGSPVKAPYPTKLVKPAIELPRWERYVLVHGVVNKDGRFENLRVVRSVKYELDQTLLAALNGWEFRAATRDGASIAVEFLLSIPAKGF